MSEEITQASDQASESSLDAMVSEVNSTLAFFQKNVLAPLTKLVKEMQQLPMIGVDDYNEFLEREAEYDPSSFEETIQQQEALMGMIEQHAQGFVDQLSALEAAEKREGETPASQAIVRKAVKMQEAIQMQVEQMHKLGQEVMTKSIMFMQAELAQGQELSSEDKQMMEELGNALGDLSQLVDEGKNTEEED